MVVLRQSAAPVVVPFSPASLTETKAWYAFSDATAAFSDAGVTPVVANDPIYRVNDKSSNGNHLTQATLAKRLLWKTNILNGKAIARADGVNDSIPSSTFTAIPEPFDIFLVVKFTGSPGGADGHITAGSAAGARTGEIMKTSTDFLGFQAAAGSYSGTAIGAGWRILLARFNGAATKIYSDGNLLLTGDSGSTNSIDGVTIGSYKDGTSNPFAGDYAHYVLATVLSTANVNSVGNYLAADGGLTWSAVS